MFQSILKNITSSSVNTTEPKIVKNLRSSLRKFIDDGDGNHIDITEPKNIGNIPSINFPDFLTRVSERLSFDSGNRYTLIDGVNQSAWYINYKCDFCNRKIGDITYRHNPYENFDLCEDCYNNDELINNYKPKHKFGSLLDWEIFARDSKWCDEYLSAEILCNINKDIDHYQQFAIHSYDDHSREGFYVVQQSNEEFLKELTEYKDSPDGPIKEYMYKNNMQCELG